jgi:hypothetical protein
MPMADGGWQIEKMEERFPERLRIAIEVVQP